MDDVASADVGPSQHVEISAWWLLTSSSRSSSSQLGTPELAARFPANPDRVAHDDEITGLIEAGLDGMTADAAAERLDALGIANARLRTAEELADHPQLAARDRWRTVQTPGGPVRMPLPPVTVPGRTPSLGRVPALGADNDAVRR